MDLVSDTIAIVAIVFCILAIETQAHLDPRYFEHPSNEVKGPQGLDAYKANSHIKPYDTDHYRLDSQYGESYYVDPKKYNPNAHPSLNYQGGSLDKGQGPPTNSTTTLIADPILLTKPNNLLHESTETPTSRIDPDTLRTLTNLLQVVRSQTTDLKTHKESQIGNPGRNHSTSRTRMTQTTEKGQSSESPLSDTNTRPHRPRFRIRNYFASPILVGASPNDGATSGTKVGSDGTLSAYLTRRFIWTNPSPKPNVLLSSTGGAQLGRIDDTQRDVSQHNDTLKNKSQYQRQHKAIQGDQHITTELELGGSHADATESGEEIQQVLNLNAASEPYLMKTREQPIEQEGKPHIVLQSEPPALTIPKSLEHPTSTAKIEENKEQPQQQLTQKQHQNYHPHQLHHHHHHHHHQPKVTWETKKANNKQQLTRRKSVRRRPPAAIGLGHTKGSRSSQWRFYARLVGNIAPGAQHPTRPARPYGINTLLRSGIDGSSLRLISNPTGLTNTRHLGSTSQSRNPSTPSDSPTTTMPEGEGKVSSKTGDTAMGTEIEDTIDEGDHRQQDITDIIPVIDILPHTRGLGIKNIENFNKTLRIKNLFGQLIVNKTIPIYPQNSNDTTLDDVSRTNTQLSEDNVDTDKQLNDGIAIVASTQSEFTIQLQQPFGDSLENLHRQMLSKVEHRKHENNKPNETDFLQLKNLPFGTVLVENDKTITYSHFISNQNNLHGDKSYFSKQKLKENRRFKRQFPFSEFNLDNGRIHEKIFSEPTDRISSTPQHDGPRIVSSFRQPQPRIDDFREHNIPTGGRRHPDFLPLSNFDARPHHAEELRLAGGRGDVVRGPFPRAPRPISGAHQSFERFPPPHPRQQPFVRPDHERNFDRSFPPTGEKLLQNSNLDHFRNPHPHFTLDNLPIAHNQRIQQGSRQNLVPPPFPRRDRNDDRFHGFQQQENEEFPQHEVRDHDRGRDNSHGRQNIRAEHGHETRTNNEKHTRPVIVNDRNLSLEKAFPDRKNHHIGDDEFSTASHQANFPWVPRVKPAHNNFDTVRPLFPRPKPVAPKTPTHPSKSKISTKTRVSNRINVGSKNKHHLPNTTIRIPPKRPQLKFPIRQSTRLPPTKEKVLHGPFPPSRPKIATDISAIPKIRLPKPRPKIKPSLPLNRGRIPHNSRHGIAKFGLPPFIDDGSNRRPITSNVPRTGPNKPRAFGLDIKRGFGAKPFDLRPPTKPRDHKTRVTIPKVVNSRNLPSKPGKTGQGPFSRNSFDVSNAFRKGASIQTLPTQQGSFSINKDNQKRLPPSPAVKPRRVSKGNSIGFNVKTSPSIDIEPLHKQNQINIRDLNRNSNNHHSVNSDRIQSDTTKSNDIRTAPIIDTGALSSINLNFNFHNPTPKPDKSLLSQNGVRSERIDPRHQLGENGSNMPFASGLVPPVSHGTTTKLPYSHLRPSVTRTNARNPDANIDTIRPTSSKDKNDGHILKNGDNVNTYEQSYDYDSEEIGINPIRPFLIPDFEFHKSSKESLSDETISSTEVKKLSIADHKSGNSNIKFGFPNNHENYKEQLTKESGDEEDEGTPEGAIEKTLDGFKSTKTNQASDKSPNAPITLTYDGDAGFSKFGRLCSSRERMSLPQKLNFEPEPKINSKTPVMEESDDTAETAQFEELRNNLHLFEQSKTDNADQSDKLKTTENPLKFTKTNPASTTHMLHSYSTTAVSVQKLTSRRHKKLSTSISPSNRSASSRSNRRHQPKLIGSHNINEIGVTNESPLMRTKGPCAGGCSGSSFNLDPTRGTKSAPFAVSVRRLGTNGDSRSKLDFKKYLFIDSRQHRDSNEKHSENDGNPKSKEAVALDEYPTKPGDFKPYLFIDSREFIPGTQTGLFGAPHEQSSKESRFNFQSSEVFTKTGDKNDKTTNLDMSGKKDRASNIEVEQEGMVIQHDENDGSGTIKDAHKSQNKTANAEMKSLNVINYLANSVVSLLNNSGVPIAESPFSTTKLEISSTTAKVPTTKQLRNTHSIRTTIFNKFHEKSITPPSFDEKGRILPTDHKKVKFSSHAIRSWQKADYKPYLYIDSREYFPPLGPVLTPNDPIVSRETNYNIKSAEIKSEPYTTSEEERMRQRMLNDRSSLELFENRESNHLVNQADRSKLLDFGSKSINEKDPSKDEDIKTKKGICDGLTTENKKQPETSDKQPTRSNNKVALSPAVDPVIPAEPESPAVSNRPNSTTKQENEPPSEPEPNAEPSLTPANLTLKRTKTTHAASKDDVSEQPKTSLDFLNILRLKSTISSGKSTKGPPNRSTPKKIATPFSFRDFDLKPEIVPLLGDGVLQYPGDSAPLFKRRSHVVRPNLMMDPMGSKMKSVTMSGLKSTGTRM